MTFRIQPLDSVSITATGAGAYTIPTGTVSAYTQEHSAPLLLNIWVSGSSNCWIQSSGSSNAGDGRYIESGMTAEYGPVTQQNFPQIRFDGAGGCWVSFDVWGSGV